MLIGGGADRQIVFPFLKASPTYCLFYFPLCSCLSYISCSSARQQPFSLIRDGNKSIEIQNEVKDYLFVLLLILQDRDIYRTKQEFLLLNRFLVQDDRYHILISFCL
jgi:hypothetical protein